MRKIYENLTKEKIVKDLYDIDFDFEELDKIEKQLLKDHIIRISNDTMEFEMVSVEKTVQPLDILIKLKTNKSTGDVLVKMKDKDDVTLGMFKFVKLKVLEISNLIDFDFESTSDQKTLTLSFIYDDILYSSDGKEFEKLS